LFGYVCDSQALTGADELARQAKGNDEVNGANHSGLDLAGEKSSTNAAGKRFLSLAARLSEKL
jgi:hypothetical protein